MTESQKCYFNLAYQAFGPAENPRNECRSRLSACRLAPNAGVGIVTNAAAVCGAHVGAQPLSEAVPIARLLRRPSHFGQRHECGKEQK